MSECTHHWTVTSECPFCLRKEIELLYDQVKTQKELLEFKRADIERLRDQVTRLSTLVDTERSLHDSEIDRLRNLQLPDEVVDIKVVIELRAEVERLSDIITQLQNEREAVIKVCVADEMERLQKLIGLGEVGAKALADAKEENSLLREILEECLPHFERGQPILWKRIREVLRK